jgi:hypothetical protein
VGKGDPLAQLQFIDELFGLAISAEGGHLRVLRFRNDTQLSPLSALFDSTLRGSGGHKG